MRSIPCEDERKHKGANGEMERRNGKWSFENGVLSGWERGEEKNETLGDLNLSSCGPCGSSPISDADSLVAGFQIPPVVYIH